MDANIAMPAGYQAIDNDARHQLSNRSLNGANIILKENEVITVQSLVSSIEPTFVDDKGNKFYSVRLLCASSVKPNGRLLTVNHFNPYPKDRVAFLRRTDFGDEVAQFQGTVEDFCDYLVGKSLRVCAIEKLPCRRKVNDEVVDTEAYFHLFEFADKANS